MEKPAGKNILMHMPETPENMNHQNAPLVHMQAKKSKKRLKKLTIFIVILSITSGALFVVFKSLSGPAEGVVSIPAVQDKADSVVPLKDFKTKFFTSKYVGRYSIQSSSKNSASLDAWLLVAHQVQAVGPAGIISVTVSKLPIGGVKEDGSYKQFAAFTDRYKLSERTYGTDKVYIAERTIDNFEHTALWEHGNYLLAIAMTSGQKNELLLAEFETIMSNLKWNS